MRNLWLHEVNSTRTKSSTIRNNGSDTSILYNHNAIGIQTFTDDLQRRVNSAIKVFDSVTHWQQTLLLLKCDRAPKTRLCSSSSLALCNAAFTAQLRSRWIALPTQSAAIFTASSDGLRRFASRAVVKPITPPLPSAKMGTMWVAFTPISACPLLNGSSISSKQLMP